MMHYCNDNARTPAEHRAIVEAQRASHGEREPERTGACPQGRRLHRVGNLVLATGLASWQTLNAVPRLSAANDNAAIDAEHTETIERDIVDADTIVAAVEAEKTEPGKHYREETQEVYVVTKRDKDGQLIKGEWRPIVGETGTERKHSASTPAWLVDDESEEDKAVRRIDCHRIRENLGRAVCTLLDMAAGGATTTEIAEAVGCSRAKAERYVDMAIQKYLQIAA